MFSSFRDAKASLQMNPVARSNGVGKNLVKTIPEHFDLDQDQISRSKWSIQALPKNQEYFGKKWGQMEQFELLMFPENLRNGPERLRRLNLFIQNFLPHPFYDSILTPWANTTNIKIIMKMMTSKVITP